MDSYIDLDSLDPEPPVSSFQDFDVDVGDILQLPFEQSATRLRQMVALKYSTHTKDLGIRVQNRMRRMHQVSRQRFRAALHKSHIPERLMKPAGIRFLDKLSFILGVLGLLITQYVLLVFPGRFWMWHCVALIPLLLFRWYSYTKQHYQYFLIDFCYYANFLLLVAVLIPPLRSLMFPSMFAFASGVLLWALVVWRNSLVFHSADKTTSVYLHAFPACLVYDWRWGTAPDVVTSGSSLFRSWALPHDAPSEALAFLSCRPVATAAGAVTNATATVPTSCSPVLNHLWSLMIVPLILYSVWQVLYLWRTEVKDKARLSANPQLITSLRWLSTDTSNPMFVALKALAIKCNMFGPDEVPMDSSLLKTKLIFVGAQFIFTVLVLIPGPLLIWSYTAHTSIMCGVFLFVLWQGASFYFDYWAFKYPQQFAARTEAAALRQAAAAAAAGPQGGKRRVGSVGGGAASPASSSPLTGCSGACAALATSSPTVGPGTGGSAGSMRAAMRNLRLGSGTASFSFGQRGAGSGSRRVTSGQAGSVQSSPLPSPLAQPAAPAAPARSDAAAAAPAQSIGEVAAAENAAQRARLDANAGRPPLPGAIVVGGAGDS